MKLIDNIKKAINYYRYPKYVLISSGSMYGRSMFRLGKDCKQDEIPYAWKMKTKLHGKFEYNNGYYKDYCFMRIWTFKQLIKVVRTFRDRTIYIETREANFWNDIKIEEQ